MNRKLIPLILSALFFAVTPPAYSDDQTLFDVPLQDLVNMNITSVSKRAEKRSAAAAAVYVITNEDIRRYGARSIPEALRLAPGMRSEFSRTILAPNWTKTSDIRAISPGLSLPVISIRCVMRACSAWVAS